MRMLVALASRHGSTLQLGEAITHRLRELEVDADLREVEAVECLDGYDAIILGSAVYLGSWEKSAQQFVQQYKERLAQLPVWLFSSGPLDPSASERDIPPVPGLRRAMTRLDARQHVTFGGCLREGAKGAVAKMILRNGKGGDFRDFDHIEKWAAGIAAELNHG